MASSGPLRPTRPKCFPSTDPGFWVYFFRLVLEDRSVVVLSLFVLDETSGSFKVHEKNYAFVMIIIDYNL